MNRQRQACRRSRDPRGSGEVANVLKDEARYFTLPKSASAFLPKLTGAATKLYWMLFDIAQQRSAVQIEIPAYIVEDLTGLSVNSVRVAGDELQKVNLVVCGNVAHGMRCYTLINPEKGKPLPAPVRNPKTGERFKGVYHFDGQAGRSARTARKAAHPIPPPAPPADVSWDEISNPESQKVTSTTNPESQKVMSTSSKIDGLASKTVNLTSSNSLKKQRVEPSSVSLNTLNKKESLNRKELTQGKGEEVAGDEEKKESAALAKNPHCYVHGTAPDWWKRPNGDPVCGLCHPNPAEVRVQ